MGGWEDVARTKRVLLPKRGYDGMPIRPPAQENDNGIKKMTRDEGGGERVLLYFYTFQASGGRVAQYPTLSLSLLGRSFVLGGF